LDFSPENRIF